MFGRALRGDQGDIAAYRNTTLAAHMRPVAIGCGPEVRYQLTADAIAEMEKGMTGMIDPDSAIPMGQLKSPNLYLSGDIRDNVRTVGGREIQYLVVTLKLYNLKTGVVEWQDQQEFLKSSKKNKVSF